MLNMKDIIELYENTQTVDISTFEYDNSLNLTVKATKIENCKTYEELEKHVVGCLNTQFKQTNQTEFTAIWANDFYKTDPDHFKNLCFGDIVVVNSKGIPVLFIDVKGVTSTSTDNRLGPINMHSLYYFGHKYKTENLYNEYKNVDRIYLILDKHGIKHKYIDPERLYNYIVSQPQPIVNIFPSKDRQTLFTGPKINYKFTYIPTDNRLYNEDIITSAWISKSKHNKYFEL